MRVASDASIRLGQRLRATGRSWDEIADTEASRRASIEMWLTSRPDRKRAR